MPDPCKRGTKGLTIVETRWPTGHEMGAGLQEDRKLGRRAKRDTFFRASRQENPINELTR